MRRRTLLALLVASLGALTVSSAQATIGPATIDPTTPVTFGSIAVGATSDPTTVTVANTGDQPMQVTTITASGESEQFGIGTGCDGQTLAAAGDPADHCTFSVTFAPTSPGSHSATLTAQTDADVNPQVDVSGTGTQGVLTASPSPLDFGGVLVGDSDTQPVTITNTGNDTVNNIQAAITGNPEFAVEGGACIGSNLAQGDTCQVSVRFSPTGTGLRQSGTLTVTGSSPDGGTSPSPISVTLTGSGTVPELTFAPSDGLSFSAAKGSTSAAKALTVEDTGTGALKIESVTLGGTNPGQFEVVNSGSCPLSGGNVSSGGSCTIDVTYSPTRTSPADARVVVTHDGGQVSNAPLSGTVLLPGVSVRPSPVKFGSLQDGALGGPHTITVSNPGQAPLKIFHTAIVGLTPGNFRKGTDRCALHTIQPEGACTVNVRFAPHGRGARKAQLRFGTNAGPGGSFAYVYAGLTGTAVAPPHVIGLRGAVGCTIARLSWRTPDAPRLLGVRVVRNGSRIPRSPGDGTIVRHSSGFLQNGGLTQLHTYYYAVYGVYSAWDSERLVFSRPAVVTLTTGRVCTPLNGSVISDLTPFVDWTPYGRNPRYSIRLVHSGRTILIAFPRRTAFQIPSRWTYGGASHSLARGAVYFLYVYAYTRAFPNGRWIGQTTFAER